MDCDKSIHDGFDGHGLSRNWQKFTVKWFSNSPKNKDERVSYPSTQLKSNPYGLLVLCVVRSMSLSAYPVEKVSIFFVRLATWRKLVQRKGIKLKRVR